MSDTPSCPCDLFVHPKPIFNPSGRTVIAYRVGDFTAFRHALLLAPPAATGLPTETELTQWHPQAAGDLALQMMEWWAYLADILTFYNERLVNEACLNTAVVQEHVNLIIRLLGYRPRPGIGAMGQLAALVSGLRPVTLPKGLQVQSKPGPGKQPQIFELDADTTIYPVDAAAGTADAVAVDPTPNANLLTMDSASVTSVLVAGTVGGIKPNDRLLLLEQGWNGQDSNYAVVTVKAVVPEKDPRDKTNTRIQLNDSYNLLRNLPNKAAANGYTLLKSTQVSTVWQYPAAAGTVIGSTQTDLSAITRGIKVGDPVLFLVPGSSPPAQLVSVTAYSERVYYANPQGAPGPPAPDPTQSPNPTSVVPIPIPHTSFSFVPPLDVDDTDENRQAAQIYYAWQDVGTLIPTPQQMVDNANPTLSPSDGTTATLPSYPSPNPVAFVEDARGNGATAQVDSSISLHLTDPLPTPPLAAPLRVLFNLLSVSRGKAVTGEVLGSGDATVPGQEFILQKSPLTYLLDPSSTSAENYRSTLLVRVDGVEWKEVASFYGQTPDAHIFVTREDADNKTHVQFGDGIHGARLTTGMNNVVADYRYGSGKESPAAGTLTTILKPQPGLKELRNPVVVGGGADPDPPDQIRRYAPQSVLAFGRAISADDYETIAAQTPGVARARAYYTFDARQQRALVTVYVGDDSSAVKAAFTALDGAIDPNRPPVVKRATPVPIRLQFALDIDPARDSKTVTDAVTAALADPDTGLLGQNIIHIGQSIFLSQIYAACLSVHGALAVTGLTLQGTGSPVPIGTDYRYDPGEGNYFLLTPADINPPPPASAGAP